MHLCMSLHIERGKEKFLTVNQISLDADHHIYFFKAAEYYQHITTIKAYFCVYYIFKGQLLQKLSLKMFCLI